jgi:hypothetical protein
LVRGDGGVLSTGAVGATADGAAQTRPFEALNGVSSEVAGMKRLIVSGDPDIRKDAIIEYEGEEQVVFQINRQGDWHGPEEVQLWCIIGTESERDDFEKRNYVPHWLDVDRIEAEALDVVKAKGDLSV